MVSGVCTAAWIGSAVLMNHDVPAGYDLLTKDTLRVAIVDAQNSDGFQIPIALFHSNRTRIKEILEHPSEFPDGFEQTVQGTLTQWNDFNIQFVSPSDNADLTIIAYKFENGIGGEATWPKSTDDDTYLHESEEPLMFIQTHRFLNDGTIQRRSLRELWLMVSHEFGHNIGIRHTIEAAKGLWENDNFASVCSSDEIRFIFGETLNQSLMSKVIHRDRAIELDFYTKQARDFIINHPAPVESRFLSSP